MSITLTEEEALILLHLTTTQVRGVTQYVKECSEAYEAEGERIKNFQEELKALEKIVERLKPKE